MAITFDEWMANAMNVLDFGLWMNSRQTSTELMYGETRVRNNIGWNKPDGAYLSAWLQAIEQRSDMPQEQISSFVNSKLKARVRNYMNTQWLEYIKELRHPYSIANRPKLGDVKFGKMWQPKRKRYIKSFDEGKVQWTPNQFEAGIFQETEMLKRLDQYAFHDDVHAKDLDGNLIKVKKASAAMSYPTSAAIEDEADEIDSNQKEDDQKDSYRSFDDIRRLVKTSDAAGGEMVCRNGDVEMWLMPWTETTPRYVIKWKERGIAHQVEAFEEGRAKNFYNKLNTNQ